MSRRLRSPDCVEIEAQPAALNAREAAAIRNVTAHAAEYIGMYVHTWVAGARETRAPTLGPLLLAASRGPARLPTCEHILRHIGTRWNGASPPLMLRALSLFGPGELQVLDVLDTASNELVLSALNEDGQGTPRRVALFRAMESLRSIKCEGYRGTDATAALLERYAATITEVDFRVVTNGHAKCDAALARCINLTRLTCADRYPSSAWLGLSQLHTLQGVSFYFVSVAAIAAALPRLHTLHASGGPNGDSRPVEGFYSDLLPRLQSFHFQGWWPEDSADAPSLSPLHLLHDLKWKGTDGDDDDWIDEPIALPNEFYGAQPESLQATLSSIAEWLSTVEATDDDESAAHEPLAHVHDLWIGVGAIEVPNSDLARVLRAAPQLRRLTVEFLLEASDLEDDDEEEEPALAEVVHPRLRHLVVKCSNDEMADDEVVDCAVKLQQRYFPRLRRLTVNDQDYPVSAME